MPGDRNQFLNDAETAMRAVLDGRQVVTWTALPGIVTKVTLSNMTCEVQPAIQSSVEDEDGNLELVSLPVLINVPIVFPSAGGFTITFPIAVGDEVLVVFSSRCIDAWWQNGDVQPPMEARMHDLSDGFAIPGPKSVPNALTGISSTGVQIRNDEGTTYVEIAANGKIKLVTPSDVEVTGNLKVSGDVVAGTVSLKNHTHPVNVPSTPFSGNTGAPT